MYNRYIEKCGFSVALGAPTGRAAKRMSESTGREAKTIHRMLEMGIRDDKDFSLFLEDETTLRADVIIIDEASMIDVIVMNSLLKAIKWNKIYNCRGYRSITISWPWKCFEGFNRK